MAVKFSEHVNRRRTAQTDPIPGEAQVRNNAGGYVYEIDKWARLQRFLVLGTDGGTYYVAERALTRENAAVVDACLAEDGMRTIKTIGDVSDAGRAPKNDPAIFALALAAAAQNPDAQGVSSAAIRAAALADLPRVCRIPTHLFHFVDYVKALRGFGRGLRTAIRNWYARWTPDQLAYELVKYQARDGWSHRDVLRQAHPRLPVEAQAALRWAIGAPSAERTVQQPKGSALPPRVYGSVGVLPAIIEAFEEAKTCDRARLLALIRERHLTREMVPSAALNDPAVWEALLERMPLTAMVRNLGKMSAVGLLTPLSAASESVVWWLNDADALRRSRVHPLAVLNALYVYQQGRGDKGSLVWAPVPQVVDALDAAFYAAFRNVEPTGKRILLALDVSSSMTARIAGTGLSCREASAALALVTAAVEPRHAIVGFTTRAARAATTGIAPLDLSKRRRLDDVVRYLSGLPFGGTDCALPMIYAKAEKLDVDAFLVYTDSETWAGSVHPKQALRAYRDARVAEACQVVVGMTATRFSIADPADPRTLDVVGFDTATPEAIALFVRG